MGGGPGTEGGRRPLTPSRGALRGHHSADVQRGFEAVGPARSQRQKRSCIHWWGAEEVSVDEK